jgi:hypothetical protein
MDVDKPHKRIRKHANIAERNIIIRTPRLEILQGSTKGVLFAVRIRIDSP